VSIKSAALVSGDESAVNIKLNGTERVLIVDDEVDVADALSLGLSRLGYETAPIYGSAEALNLILKYPWAWDVMISDQKMPGLRGLDLIQRVKVSAAA